jgi:hypothetical protein
MSDNATGVANTARRIVCTLRNPATDPIFGKPLPRLELSGQSAVHGIAARGGHGRSPRPWRAAPSEGAAEWPVPPS